MANRRGIKSVAIVALGGIASLLSGATIAATAAVAAQPVAIDSPEYKRGKLLFIQCRACHELQAGKPHKVGPNLNGFIGRKAGDVEGFNFSAALKKADLTWSDATVLKWLEKPSALVPGNTMAFAGISNPKDRDAMMVYLKAETQPAK